MTDNFEYQAPIQGGRWIWFFFPLPEPLGLPDKWVNKFVNQSTLEEIVEGAPPQYVSSSICVHQLDIPTEEAFPQIRPIIDLAFKRCPVSRDPETCVSTDNNQNCDSDSYSLSADSTQYSQPSDRTNEGAFRLTIVEVSLPLSDQRVDELIVSNLFDEGLELVRHLQESYAILKQQPVTLLTRNTLPFAIPMAEGEVFVAPHNPKFEYVAPFLTGNETWNTKIPKEEISESDQERLVHVLDNFVDGGEAFSSYAQLRNEAWCQYYQNGNYRLACLTVGIASEVMLDTLLLHLLWEEETAPEVAALVFDKTLKTRVLTEFRRRLAGNWSETGTGVVASYIKNMLYLRNRIAHVGYYPTESEVENAFSSLASLERYIGDRLTHSSKLNTWPRTATKWCGIKGLKKRGKLTKRLIDLNQSNVEPDWMNTFNRWRSHFSRCRGYIAHIPGSDAESLKYFADIFPDCTIRWIVHDIKACMAAEVDAAIIASKDQIDKVAQIAKMLGNAERKTHLVRTSILGVAPLAESVGLGFAWKPDYEIILEYPIYHSARPPVYAS